MDRRSFLGVTAVAGLGALATAKPEPPAPPPVPEEFPTQAPGLVREMVGVSHGNVARVKELLALHPTLANANWDWGFGDWESALGAASHVGNVEIARMLLAHGARPSIFSAAMLGQLAVVRAFVEATPGVQGTAGPHGITLMAHARAGGEGAKPVVAYLEEVGGADPKGERVELSAEVLERYTGVYAFGPREGDRIEVGVNKGAAQLKRGGMAARGLVPLGDHAFRPVGAPAVRVRFVLDGDKASELTVFDPDLVLRARRVG